MISNFWNKILNYNENKQIEKKINDTKRVYIDGLQMTLNKILDEPNKMKTGLNQKPIEYIIQISNKKLTNIEPEYIKTHKNTKQQEIIQRYDNKSIILENNLISITIQNNPKSTKNKEINIEIAVEDSKTAYKQKFSISSIIDYKNAKTEICKYIQYGEGSWVYTNIPGKLFN